jgi:primosomal protein N' (replication factor Y) (superfamily II helicase)
MKNYNQKFLIDVVPLIRLPLDHEPAFTYVSDQPILKGSYVLVEFFRREIGAIVVRCHHDFERFSSIRLKPINRIISPSFVTKNQVALADFISKEYFTPLGICLKSFVPKIAKSKKVLPLGKNKITKIKIAQQISEKLKKICITEGYEKILLNGFPDNEKYQIFAAIAKMNFPQQIFICSPEILTGYHCYQEMLRFFPPENVAYLTGQIAAGEFYRQWEKIRTGSAKIIIGTRIAIFAPYNSLSSVIINDAQDQSFKQWDMSPRYDARVVAQKLGEIHQSKIFFQSPFPSLADCLAPKKNKKISISRPVKKTSPQVEIINMKLEWKYGKLRSPISGNLEKIISGTLSRNEQAIIFLNQQGMSRFSVCTNCKKVLRCPKCSRALIFKRSGIFSCPSCNYHTSLFPNCPNCRGSAFKNYGFGIDKIEKELEKFFPGAKIAAINSSVLRKIGKLEEIYHDFVDRKIDILVGTQLAIKAWDISHLSLAAIIDADHYFNFPEYNTEEIFWNDLIQCANRVASNLQGKVALQTYHPEAKIFQMAESLDSDKFYPAELENRKILNYPPFYRLIKISFKHKNYKAAIKEIEKIKSLIKDSGLGAISPPYQTRKKSTLNQEQSILIKFVGNQIPGGIRLILEKLPPGWTIDVDPVNIT